jgi:diguanylate cyclase (GGDEF)-like protein
LKSIKSKIFVFAMIATLIPSLGLGLLSFRLNETLINDNLTRELLSLADFTSRELDLWIYEQIHAANALSTSDIIVDRLSVITQTQTNEIDTLQQALTQYLRAVHEKLDTVLELTVVDTDGRLIASSTGLPAPVTLPQDWSQNASINGIVSTPPHWNKYYSVATLSIAIPVLSYDDFVIGALVTTLDLQSLKPSLKDTTKLPLGDVILIDSAGNVLLSSHVEINQPVSLDSELLEQLKAQDKNPLTFESLLQRKVIGLGYISEKLRLTIIAERDHKEVYAAWIKLRNLFLALVGVLILVVTAIALRMGRAIVKPLQDLINATKQIVGGDLDVRLTIARNDELGQLAHTFNQMTEKLLHKQAKIITNNEVMEQKNKQLEALSVTDSLTGLYNRNKLNMIIADQLARFKRNHRPFAMLMMDVDHFKTLNDSLGHIVGDKILSAVAKILIQSIRNVDFAARYGGDEFIIILTETNVNNALKTAERIRSQVVEILHGSDDKKIAVTLSIGIVQCQPEDTTSTILLTRADKALYAAKHAGRNQSYCIHPDQTKQ